MEGRALRPYPPVVVEFDGALAPATVVNIDPIAVEWKKRDRRKTKISLPSGPDEAVETGTEYVVRHGPPGFETTTVIGDDSDTTGSFNLDFKGFSRVEFFARRDGYESTIYAFDTIAENGAGASVAASLATVNVQMNMTGAVAVQKAVALPAPVVITFSDPVDIEIEDMPTITLTAPDGGVDVTTDITEYFIVSLSAFDGSVEVGTAANTSGNLDTIDVSGLDTAEVTITVNTSGDVGTVTVSNLIETEVTGEVDKSAAIGTVSIYQVEGEAEGAVGGVNKSILLASSGVGQTLSTASTTTYIDITGHHLLRSVNTESYTQLKIRQAGTLRKARVLVPTNGRSTATVMKLRVNSADSAISVSCTGNTTGWFADDVNEVAVVPGDLVNLAFTTGSGAGNFIFNQTILEFEADTGVITYYSFNGRQNITNDGTTTLYNSAQGGARNTIFGWTTSRNYQQTKTLMGAAQTLSHLSVDVAANTSNVGATWTVMLNGSATALEVSAGAGVTGRVENTSDTVTVAPGDYLELRMVTTGRTSGGVAFTRIEWMSTSTDGEFDILSNPLDAEDPGGTASIGNPNYSHMGARSTPSTTEAARGIKLPFAMDFTRFRVSASSAGSGFGAYDLYARLNGSNTALVVSVPSGGGLSVVHEDNTHSASGGEDDLLTIGFTPLGSVSGIYLSGITAKAA